MTTSPITPTSPAPHISGRQPIDRLVFRCGRCHRPSSQAGRRRRHVLGLAVWVCASCVAKEPKP